MSEARTAAAKTPRASRVVMTESVLPGDGNPLGTAFGGASRSGSTSPRPSPASAIAGGAW